MDFILRNSNGRKEENNAIGTCVPENSELCPGPDILNLEDGVNCRPGQLGILANALYCPDKVTQQKSVNKQPSADAEETITNRPESAPVTPPPNGAPSLIELILSQVPKPFKDPIFQGALNAQIFN